MDEPLSESVAGPDTPTRKARARTKSVDRPVHPIETTRDAESVKLFAASLGDLSDTMARIAANSTQFATFSGRELVVDVAALVAALYYLERRTRVPTAAGWLQEWVEASGITFSFEFNVGSTNASALMLSATLRTVVLPRALSIRDATMIGAPEPVGARHLLFALAEQPVGKWPAQIEGELTDERLAGLRALIVERTAIAPRQGEDMSIWRSLLEAGPPPPPSPPLAERTPLLSDNPAAVDELGRKPLADALAARLVRLQREEAASPAPKAVMVHLHGPWGSGKSSLVKFLTDTLTAENPPWLVVDFNAWRNARVKPPWWNMLTEFKRALDRRLPWWRRRWLDLRWAWVSPSVDNVSLVMAALVAALLLLLFGAQMAAVLKAWQTQLGVLTALFTVVGLGRSQLLGGKRVAESFDALRTDSFRPFITLFDMLVTECPCPVLIVLDDLDRCDADTVTDLLEGIQTLFRGQPVVFLAVADRYWITASFAKRFSLFEDGGDKARPVGDLFLDKMFQVSVTIPALPVAVKRAYLGKLLGSEEAALPEAVTLPETAMRHEEIQAAIAAAPEEQRPALRAQAVERLSSVAADRLVEHRLLRWASYIEPNPSGMKRLVNAIGLMQARSLLEGRTVDFDTIVLWTILDLRWPRAATVITADPGLIDAEGAGPDPIKAAWSDPLFQKIAGELDATRVRALVGTADEDEDETPA